MDVQQIFIISMPLFRLPLLALAFFGLFLASCSKSHDMDPAHDSVHMTIMMDMMTQMDAQAKTQDPTTTTQPRWCCTTKPPSKCPRKS